MTYAIIVWCTLCQPPGPELGPGWYLTRQEAETEVRKELQKAYIYKDHPERVAVVGVISSDDPPWWKAR